jgi:hypothetical protein
VQKTSKFDEFFFRSVAKVLLGIKVRGRAGSQEGYSVDVSEKKNEIVPPGIGLCADCCFMRRIESDRGSIFYLCERSAVDANFPKYPRLPVLRCAGYEPSGSDGKLETE